MASFHPVFKSAVLKKTLLFATLLLMALRFFAGHEIGSSRLNFSTYNASTNNSLYLEDNKFATVFANLATPSSIGFFDQTYKNKIVLGIDRTITSLGAISTNLTNNVFRVEVDVTINYSLISLSGSPLVYTAGQTVKTLTVSFSGFNSHTSASAPTTETDLDVYNFTSSYQNLASITAVRVYNSYSSTTPIVTTNVPANVYLELQCDAERYYSLNTSATAPYTSNSALIMTHITGTSNGDGIQLDWNRIPGAETYDIEWMWLDQYSSGGGGANINGYWSGAPELNFRNNSTRIRTDQNTYVISNIYESGYLLFRIRGVGSTLAPTSLTSLGNPALSDIFTNWTWPDNATPPNSSPATPSGVTGVSGAVWPFFFNLTSLAHEQGKNWVYTSVFAEEGKRNEVVSYFDGAQYNRQTVTRNNSDNIAVVGETYYDYQGKATIHAMPTPVADATIKFYQQTVAGKTAFNFDPSGNAFTKDIFASAPTAGQCAVTLSGFHTSYGTGGYYSPNNVFQSLNYNNGYTPDGESFPFTQTEYTPDNTGRVARQGGVGPTMKIENSGSLPKHDTRYLYGSVTQDELDRLFGSEAGYASHYTKNVVVDANGQSSISYVDQNGKVVATALSGAKPANLQSLLASDGVTDLSTTSMAMTTDLLNKQTSSSVDSPQDNNILTNGELIYNEKLVVTAPQVYSFDYSLLGSTYTAPGCSSLYKCVYDLTFDIQDKCGNRPAGFNPIIYTLGNISGSSPPYTTTYGSTVNFDFTQILSGAPLLNVTLDVGEYTITKRLKVNEAYLQTYVNDYLTNCVHPQSWYDTQEAGNLNASGCGQDCQTCATNLGTRAAYIAANTDLSAQDAGAQWDALYQACYAPCEYDSYCEVARDAMLDDLSPGGQYAEYTQTGNTADASTFPLSIYNTNNSLPKRNSLSSLTAPPTWKNPIPAPYLNKTIAGGASGYLDENGNSDKISVFETPPGSGVYNPPVTGVMGPGTNPNEFYARPEDLSNLSDFITLFKPSWAQSLLIYHPEYPYIEWCVKNSAHVASTTISYNNYNYGTSITLGTPGTSVITSSDDYDSLYVNIDDLDDIDNTLANSYDVIFNPMTYDPYWVSGGAGQYYIASNSGNSFGIPCPVFFTPNPSPNPALNIANSTNGNLIPQSQSATSSSPADFSSYCTMYANRRADKTANNRYFNFMGSGLALYQYAALLATPLGLQYGQTMTTLLPQLTSSTYYAIAPTTAKEYILNIQKPGSPGDDSYKRAAWENYKTLYLTMKQQLQQEAAQSYVMNGASRGCNDCIGKPAFEVNSVKYTTYSSDVMGFILVSYIGGNITLSTFVTDLLNSIEENWFMPPFSGISPQNADQVCGLATKDLYVNKTKRYYKADDASSLIPNGQNNIGATIYAQTGLCPIAYDLQSFLNAMLPGNALYNTSNYDLSINVPAFSQNLYQAIVPPGNFTSFADAIYKCTGLSASPNTNVLNATITMAGSTPCALSLAMPATLPTQPAPPLPQYPANIIDWTQYQGGSPTYEINQLTGFQPTGVGNQFTVAAVISSTGANPITYTLQLLGNSTCFPLTGCSFLPPCQVNGTGEALNALFNAFASNNAFPAPFSSGSYQNGSLLNSSGATPYSYVFTNTFKPLLETGSPLTTWEWSYTSTGATGIDIWDGTAGTSNKRLKIAFTTPFNWQPAPGSSGTMPALSCIRSFQNFQPDPAVPGGFIVQGITDNQNGCQTGTIIVQGVVTMGAYNSGYIYTPLNVGSCSFELATCNTPQHQVKRDLQAWMLGSGSGFVPMVTSGTTQNISGNPFLTNLLRSYLNSATTYNSNGPVQNFYYWLPDATNTSATQICGWLVVNQTGTTPTSAPAGSCYMALQKITNSSSPAISSMLTTNAGSLFQVATGPYVGNDVYSFKLLTNAFGTTDSLLCNTSCFPLRSCDACSSPAQSAPPPSVLDIIIEDLSDQSSFTLTKNNANMTYVSCPTACNVTTSNYTMDFYNSPAVAVSLPYNSCGVTSGTYGETISLGAVSPGIGVGPAVLIIPLNTLGTAGSVVFTKNYTFNSAGGYTFKWAFNPWINYSSYSGTINYSILIDGVSVYTNNYNPPIFQIAIPISAPFTIGNPGIHQLQVQYTIPSGLCGDLLNMFAWTIKQTSSAASYFLPCVNAPWPTDTLPTVAYQEPCAPYLQDVVDNSAAVKYQDALADAKNTFIQNYTNYCLSSAIENLKMVYQNTDYHFTLYYYDQAGNLVRTIPPEGVKPINLTAANGAGTNRDAIKLDRLNYGSTAKVVYTHHNYQTTYTYNSLNQLTQQTTPDAGLSKFYYDNLGRLAASQNAEQKYQSTLQASNNQIFSYTHYDALNRITMVGQLGTTDLSIYPPPSGQSMRDLLSASNYPLNLTIFSGSHVQVTQTYYGDDPAFTPIANAGYFANGRQENLRGRVATVSIEDVYDGNNTTYNHATHYSYDIHGNVKDLVQENPTLSRFNYFVTQQNKHMEYTYDLISGKVNSVTYQRGQPDMFAHNYVYDAMNRITNVYSSRDGNTWDQDAKYYYYLHGPLRRTELGQHKVQGVDYAYTLQGWLKGVNSERLVNTNDMGKDGYSTLTGASNSYNLDRFVARDGYGYALNYYTNAASPAAFDYKPVNGGNATASTYFLGNLGSTYGITQLFNGNITALSAGYLNPSPTPISLTSLGSAVTVNKYDPYTFMNLYTYDQLNRIRSARAGAKAIDASNNWMYTVLGNLPNEFAEDFKYDENGNITTVQRRLNPSNTYDNLSYYYYNSTGTPYNPASPPGGTIPTNKLAYVIDGSGAATIGDIGNQSSSNYTYDHNGNLTGDTYESISGISWSVYRKIKNITRSGTTKPALAFNYDATGNRISKKVTDPTTGIINITYYVRDAQGNVMATYNENVNGVNNLLSLVELDIYGSSRLGVKTCNTIIGSTTSGVSGLGTGMVTAMDNRRILGYKSYELGNHLGNVLATISDRKLPVSAGGTTIDNFVPDLLSGTDYYAFGAPVPGRQYNNGNYRYGFNGKENDNEVKGTGNEQDYGARIYDPRVGRWLSLDPLQVKYPALTPYNFCNNNPVLFIDPDGNDIFISYVATVEGKPVLQRVQYKNGELINNDGTKYTGSNAYFMKVKEHLDNMKTRDPDINKMVTELSESPNYHEITNSIDRAAQLSSQASPEYNEANYDLTNDRQPIIKDGKELENNTVTYFPEPYRDKTSTEAGDSDKEGVLAHELKHAHDKQTGTFKKLETSYGEGGVQKSEISAVKAQNKVQTSKHKPERRTYGKEKITKKDFESVK